MMDCKANKARPTTSAVKDIVAQLDLVFLFGNEVTICSADSPESIKLLQGVLKNEDAAKLSHAEIRLAHVSEKLFYEYHARKDSSTLVDAFYDSSSKEPIGSLYVGTILSVRTDSNKYGLINIKSLTPFSCEVDACHVLL